MDLLPEEESVSIVLLGNFNPPIFVPLWFQNNGLIDAATASSANIEIIHPEVAIFTTDWFRLQVETNRMVLRPIKIASVTVFDMCVRMFTEFLPHTPLRAVGLNYIAQYKLPSLAAFHAIGDKLAPKNVWGEWGEILLKPAETTKHGQTNVNKRSGGLRSMVMEQTVRPDDLDGSIRAKLESSQDYFPGLKFEINDHYVFGKEDSGNSASSNAAGAMDLIRDKFDASTNRAKWIIAQIIGQVE